MPNYPKRAPANQANTPPTKNNAEKSRAYVCVWLSPILAYAFKLGWLHDLIHLSSKTIEVQGYRSDASAPLVDNYAVIETTLRTSLKKTEYGVLDTSPSVVGLSIGYHGIKGLAIFGMDFARLAGRLVGTALYIEICSVP